MTQHRVIQQLGQTWTWCTINFLSLLLRNLILQIRAQKKSLWGKSEVCCTSFHLLCFCPCFKKVLNYIWEWVTSAFRWGCEDLGTDCLSVSWLQFSRESGWLVYPSPGLFPPGQVHPGSTSYSWSWVAAAHCRHPQACCKVGVSLRLA